MREKRAMSLRCLPSLSLVLLLAAGCAATRPSSDGAANGSDVDPASQDGASVAHRDPRTGAPSFVWWDGKPSARHASLDVAAAEMTPRLAKAFGVPRGLASSLHLAAIQDGALGPIVLRYQQRVGGLEVFRGAANVVLSRDLAPVAATGSLATTLDGSDTPFAVAAEAATAVAVTRTSGGALAGVSLSSRGERDEYTLFGARGLAAPTRAKRVLYPRGRGAGAELVPAWYVEVQVANGPAHSVVVSGTDGRVLFENDLVRHAAYAYRVWADPETKVPLDGPQGNAFAPHPTSRPDRTKLAWVPSQLVTMESLPFSKAAEDPWLPADATVTTGNNVDAYADIGGGNGFSGEPDVRATLTGPLAFDHSYDTAASPSASLASKQASVTHLFYVLNFLHDWFYDAGFDEKNGNHQSDNKGRGGLSGDPLVAEAQDFSGRNNANALVPADGFSPRIQMFVFSGASSASIEVTAPSNIAGAKPVGIAPGFGDDVFDLSGDVVVAQDGQGADLADACEPLEVAVTGKIVLAHRGLCSFAQKAQNAEAAGAAALVIANVASSTSPTTPPYMGGTANGITIPVLSLALADGAALEAAAASGGATITMKRSLGADLDGALDTSIVSHEWGHVLSSRLVGNGNGLTTNQAGGLGEGWGDFVSLLVMARPTTGGGGTVQGPDALSGVYANGAYATSGSGDDIYFGIRRVPYSVDQTKSPLTLKHIQNGVPLPETAAVSFGEDGSFNAQVHSAGEVWATMLWECFVALVRDGRYTFDEAQTRMRRYLVASLAATPVDPTFLEARDAVLAVALATDARDFQTFFDAFARRGAGAGAKGPPKDSASNVGVVESFTSGAALEVVSATLTDDILTCDRDGILDDGEVGSLTVTVKNVGARKLEGATVELTPKTEGISLKEETLAKVPALAPFESTKLVMRTSVHGAAPTVPSDFTATIGDPSLPEPVKVVVRARYDTDETPDASTTDDVETKATSWKPKSRGEFGPSSWDRATEAGNTFWTVPDGIEPTDMRLTSAPFTIEGSSFTLSFRHKWSFRISRRRNAAIDGGVVEVSTDGGTTWTDAEKLGKVDYTGRLDSGGRGDNPLKGQNAYGAESPGYPKEWVTSKMTLTLPAPPETVMVRFRIGTGSGFTGADGWFVDDIALEGATSKPFFGFTPHADACDPDGPTADAGVPQTVDARALVTLAGAASHPTEAELSYVWRQVAGPEVVLRGADTLAPTFDAPDVTEPTVVGLQLRANDGKLVSPASRVDVTVMPGGAAGTSASCGCRVVGTASGGTLGLGLGALAVLAAMVRRRRPA